jgi:flagellar hook assembly protein FlgD
VAFGFLFGLSHLAPAAETVEFKQGFNLFQFPAEVPADYTSYDFLMDLHAIGDVVSIQRYDPATGLFQTATWHDGAPAGIEFSLKNIEGYILHSREAISIDVDGHRACGAVPLHAGFNLVGFACPPVNYTSVDLLVDLGGESAVERIKKYDPDSGRYLTTGWSGGVVSGDVFAITHPQAYLVSMQASATWGPATGPTYISGVLSEDARWKPLQGPFIITGDLEVAAGVELSIEAGTDVLVQGHSRIQVNGSLHAVGSAERPIVFTSAGWQRWAGITIAGDGGVSQLSHCVVENADVGISIQNSAPLISDSIIRENEIGIYLGTLAHPTITNSSIVDNLQIGIHLFGDRNDAHNPNPLINENNIHTNGIYDLKAENFTYQTPARINAARNWWGTAVFQSIKHRIYDRLDHGNAPFVDFSGFLDGQGGHPLASVVFGSIAADTTWTLAESPYLLAGNVEVEAGAMLTIEAGVAVKAGDGYGLLVYGVIQAEGTAQLPIRFMSYESAAMPGDWTGISLIGSDTGGSRLSYCTIEHADYGVFIHGADATVVNCVLQNNINGAYFQQSGATFSNNQVQQNKTGLFIFIEALPEITWNTIRDNSEYGIYIRGDQNEAHNPNPVINGNSIVDNGAFAVACGNFMQNTNAGVNARGNWWGTADFETIKELIFDRLDSAEAAFVDFSQYLGSEGGAAIPGTVVSGHIESETTWTPAGSPYRLIGDVLIDTGIVLTIEPGVIVESGHGYGLTVNGNLSAAGTQPLPITFTSYEHEPQTGDWSGIEFTPLSSGSELNHCVIEFADRGVACYAADLTLVDSVVEDNDQGIYVGINAAPVISGVTAVNNTRHGIAVCGDLDPLHNPEPAINGNNIFNNHEYNLYTCDFGNAASSTVNATDNWWGTTEEAQIQAFIHDQQDHGDAPVVDYASFTPEAVGLPATYGLEIEAYFSPNADGAKDTLTITADLTKTADWQIQIENADSEVIKTYSGSGTSIAQVWDGTDNLDAVVADGLYCISILATASPDSSLTRFRKTEVDNTIPQAVLTDPLEGSTLFNQTDIIGTATDSNFVRYALEYSPAAAPDSWVQIGETAANPVIEDLLQTWITNDTATDQVYVDNGSYNLRLQVEDKAGNVGTHNLVVDLNNLYLSEITNEVPIFDVSSGENARICFSINQAAEVSLKVYAERDGVTSSPVRTITETFDTAGTHCIEWDGKNDKGNLVIDDAYIFVLDAAAGEITDGFLQTEEPHTVQGSGTIDPTYDPYSNDPFQMTYTLPEPARLTMTATPLGQSVFTVIPGKPYLAGDHDITWDGRYPSGAIITVGSNVAFSAVSLRPNHFILMGNSPTVGSIQSDPIRIYISYGEYTKLNYTLNQEAYITIKLLPPGVIDYHDPAAITVQDRVLQNTGDYEMEWDGLDPVDPEGRTSLMGDEGAYNLAIQARNPATLETKIYYGAINLLR